MYVCARWGGGWGGGKQKMLLSKEKIRGARNGTCSMPWEYVCFFEVFDMHVYILNQTHFTERRAK